jgi:hypothetical protein
MPTQNAVGMAPSVDLGCTMLSLGIDVWIVNKGLKAFQDEYSEFFA